MTTGYVKVRNGGVTMEVPAGDVDSYKRAGYEIVKEPAKEPEKEPAKEPEKKGK